MCLHEAAEKFAEATGGRQSCFETECLVQRSLGPADANFDVARGIPPVGGRDSDIARAVAAQLQTTR